MNINCNKMSNAIILKNISKHFEGVKAVNDLSFDLEEGKITGIIGPNGSGKTTLVNCLTGMIELDGGEMVLANDFVIKKIKPHNVRDYGISRTFQTIRLFEQITVLDNLMLCLQERDVFDALFDRKNALYKNRAEDLLKMVGLEHKANSLAANLSYGQRKLLEIARALATDANILFFDEPFAGLFKEMIQNVVIILKKLRDEGKTIILIEHNMDLIRELCDEVVVLDAGKLLAKGKPKDVLSDKEVIEAYLGE